MALDSNGIYLYDETENETTFSDLMNLGQESISTQVGLLQGRATALESGASALGVWAAYTPTLTNVTLGTGGAVTGRYTVIGKTVHYMAQVTLGTGGALTGTFGMTLPVTPNTAMGSALPLGQATLVDNSPSTFRVYGARRGGGTPGIILTDSSASAVNATNPWTWAVNDIIIISGMYEAA